MNYSELLDDYLKQNFDDYPIERVRHNPNKCLYSVECTPVCYSFVVKYEDLLDFMYSKITANERFINERL